MVVFANTTGAAARINDSSMSSKLMLWQPDERRIAVVNVPENEGLNKFLRDITRKRPDDSSKIAKKSEQVLTTSAMCGRSEKLLSSWRPRSRNAFSALVG
jgi:Cft2 family RNA processing exonuclease